MIFTYSFEKFTSCTDLRIKNGSSINIIVINAFLVQCGVKSDPLKLVGGCSICCICTPSSLNNKHVILTLYEIQAKVTHRDHREDSVSMPLVQTSWSNELSEDDNCFQFNQCNIIEFSALTIIWMRSKSLDSVFYRLCTVVGRQQILFSKADQVWNFA